jgi:N6-L-threonylcarbamoyladenine synthase
MYYLAIESSCDETSIAILKVAEDNLQSHENDQWQNFYNRLNGIEVVSSIISSQIETHKQYGGVVPEIGARLHAEQIHGLYRIVLEESAGRLGISLGDFYKELESIFVTAEPGLMSALRVGIEFAKSLQFYIQQNFDTEVMIKPINHLQGHIASSFYSPDDHEQLPDSDIFPHLHLMISGGNTQIRVLRSWADWSIVGQTIDDAAGECFDKAARMIGIPYPGGATLSKIAGDRYDNPLGLPIAMLQSKDLNVSLSGLKTAVRYKIQKSNIPNLNLNEPLLESEIYQLKVGIDFETNPKLDFIHKICISTQFAIIEQITKKMAKAVDMYKPKSIGVSGGVSANKILLSKIQNLNSQHAKMLVFSPPIDLTGDNAVMIGLAGLANSWDLN